VKSSIPHQARCLLIAAAILCGPHLATAQPAGTSTDPAKVSQADALFRQGKAFMTAGKLTEACAAFARSQEIDPKVTTLVNHANCREKNHQLATAARLFAEAAAQLHGLADESGEALRKLATDRVASLTSRLSTFTVHLGAQQPAGFELSLGNDAIASSQWNQPRSIDGGVYSVVARAPGHQEWTATVTLRDEGDAQVVEVPVLKPDAVALAEPSLAPAVVADAASAPRPRSMALPIGLGAGAAVLGVASLGVYLWAKGTSDASLDQSRPFAERLDLWESANTRGNIALGLAGAAAGCAGLAVYLYLRGDDREVPTATARRTIAPMVGDGLAGMQLQGAW
jgi:hypothetical protein